MLAPPMPNIIRANMRLNQKPAPLIHPAKMIVSAKIPIKIEKQSSPEVSAFDIMF